MSSRNSDGGGDHNRHNIFGKITSLENLFCAWNEFKRGKIGKKNFLSSRLKLDLHPDKVIIRKLSHGIDFLGYIILPHYTVLRTKTERRIFKKLKFKKQQYGGGEITNNEFLQSFNSYLGVLEHCKGYDLKQRLIKETGFSLQ